MFYEYFKINQSRNIKSMKYLISPILCIIFTFCLGNNSCLIYGQNREDLEKKKKQTEEEIEYTTTLLENTQKTRKSTVSQVRLLNKRIQLRNQIIQSIQQEIALIDEEIEEKNRIINEMEDDIEQLRMEYETLILFAHRNRDKYNKIMFVFAAENFNQAYKRMRYLKQFTTLRRQQAQLIGEIQDEMAEEIVVLERIKQEKADLINAKTRENNNLERERSRKNQAVNTLQSKERDLKRQIREKEQVAERLKKEIELIIEAEARKTSERNIYKQLTPEEKLISDNFQDNKGRLPWPTERGIVTGHFGRHEHPVLKGIVITNNGLDISTVEGSEARALFDGEVSRVIAILGTNYTVIIRHGNFLTVYQNIINVTVKKGDKVKVKQKIGTVFTDPETNTTELHIEIWKELDKQNPEDWLSKK